MYIDVSGEKHPNMDTRDAMALAKKEGLDLVEVSPTSDPPVCKALDYGQYRYRQSKKDSVKGKHQRKQQIKKIKFRPVTDVGDFNVKLKKIREFIESGYKVELSVRFKGREISHQELGFNILSRVQEELKDLVEVYQEPKMEGRQVHMLVLPKKT